MLNESSITSFLQKQNDCVNLLQKDSNTIQKIIQILLEARKKNNTIFVMGNGGSGSTASHFVSDLLKTALLQNKKRFSAISLVDNIPVILAWSNDSSFNDIFVEQLKNLHKPGDVVIGFSGSGKSKNVINALTFANNNGGKTIGITGMDGGDFKKICNVCLIAPSNEMLMIESIHVTLCHCIISSIREDGVPIFKYDSSE